MKEMIITIFCFVLLAHSSFSMPEDLRKDFLDAHNSFRRQVAKGDISGQATAANMIEMIWSEELALTAEKSGNKCNFAHDSDDERKTKSFSDVGQNIYAGPEPKEAVKLWFDEYKDYSYDDNSCSGVCGHYTQILWADSYALGCASVNCANKNGFDGEYLVICNYGPAGNYQGEKPYSSGEACSQCPPGSKCDDGLCSKFHMDEPDQSEQNVNYEFEKHNQNVEKR